MFYLNFNLLSTTQLPKTKKEIVVGGIKKIKETTKTAIKSTGRFLGIALITFLASLGIFSLVVSFIGFILLLANIFLTELVLANDPTAIVITMALAVILSLLATTFLGAPEGTFSKLAGTGIVGMIAFLMIVAIIIGTLTYFAFVMAIIFLTSATILKKKVGIQTSSLLIFASLVSIVISIPFLLKYTNIYILILGVVYLLFGLILLFDNIKIKKLLPRKSTE